MFQECLNIMIFWDTKSAEGFLHFQVYHGSTFQEQSGLVHCLKAKLWQPSEPLSFLLYHVFLAWVGEFYWVSCVQMLLQKQFKSHFMCELRIKSWKTFKNEQRILKGAVLRWQRNRMGRPLSAPQIHWKNIWTLSKFHKTTSECWQRTSGTQKGSPLSLKGGRTKCKR